MKIKVDYAKQQSCQNHAFIEIKICKMQSCEIFIPGIGRPQPLGLTFTGLKCNLCSSPRRDSWTHKGQSMSVTLIHNLIHVVLLVARNVIR